MRKILIPILLAFFGGCAGLEDFYIDDWFDYDEMAVYENAAQPAPFTQSAPMKPQPTREPELFQPGK